MKNSIEVSKTSDGRIASGTIIERGKKLVFNCEWDDNGFLSKLSFDGRTPDLPTFTELFNMVNNKFVERIRQIDDIAEIQNIKSIDRIQLLPTNQYNKFEMYGYKHIVPARQCNDVYDVVASKDYYVASDRDLYASPKLRELVVYDRHTLQRVKTLDIGNDCSLDLRDDGKEVVYWNANSGYVEAATIPDLMVTRLFNPSFTAGSNSCVKYDPMNNDQLLVVENGNSNLRTKIWNRKTGAVIDFIDQAASQYVTAAVLEPENWVIAEQTSDQPQQHNLIWYRRDTKAEVGRIPHRPDVAINMHVKPPFLTICGDKGPPLISEFGGVPFNNYQFSTNCLYPILEENCFVGTYYFSIFEVPMSAANTFFATQAMTRLNFTGVLAAASVDVSILRGQSIILISNGAYSITQRLANPAAGNYQVGYARIYAEPSPVWNTIYTAAPAGAGNTGFLKVDNGCWQNFLLTNTSGGNENFIVLIFF